MESNDASMNILKANVVKPGSDLHAKLDSRMSVIRSLGEADMFYEDEEVVVNGKMRKVRRLFARAADSDSYGVGWIINEDITGCMVCGIDFGYFRWPHHCRSCGNLVCNPCSPETVVLFEMPQLGEVRVCKQCYWGQDPVHVAYSYEKNSRSNSVDLRNEAEVVAVPPPPVPQRPSAPTTVHDETPEFFSDVEIFEISSEYEEQERLVNAVYTSQKTIQPTPLFVLEFSCRKNHHSSSNETSEICYTYLNVCVDERAHFIGKMEGDDVEFTHFICNDVHNVDYQRPNEKTPVQRAVYLAIVHPETVVDGPNDETAGRLLLGLIGKFHLCLAKGFEILDHVTFLGNDKFTCSIASRDETPRKAAQSDKEAEVAAEKVRIAEENRVAEEARKKEQARLVEVRQKEEVRQREEARIAEDARVAEKSRLADKARAAEEARQWEEARLKEEARVAEEARAAEKSRSEKARIAEEARLKEEARQKEEARIAEEGRVAEKARLADKARAAEEARQKEESQQREEARLVEEARVSEKARLADRARVAEEARQKEEARQREEARTAEEARVAEKSRLADKARVAEEARLKEEARQKEEERIAEEARVAEVARLERERLLEEDRAKEAARIAEASSSTSSDNRRGSTSAASNVQSSDTESRRASVKEGPKPINVQIAAINATPTAWCVMKTKTDSNVKYFINVLQLSAMPDPSLPIDNNVEEAYDTYYNMHFIAFTLEKKKSLMLVGSIETTADKEGGESNVIDVVVSSEVYDVCSRDGALQDKLFIKILKAVKRKYDTDLDANYKMPKIMRNYKGNVIKTVNIPEYKTVVAPKVYFEINAEWNRSWGKYLPQGKNVVFTSEISNASKVLQLVLSDAPSLIYIDTSDGKVGEVAWNVGTPPTVVVSNKHVFEITSANRVHYFTDNLGNAEMWARKIADVTAATERRPVSRSSFRVSDAALLKDIAVTAQRRNSRDMSNSEKASTTTPTRNSVSASVSLISPPRTDLSPVRPSFYTVNPEWNRKWGKFIPAGKNVVYTSVIGKKNLVGITKIRQLVLSDAPSLIYIDPKENGGTVKGEVDWPPGNPPQATFIDKSNFELTVAKRVFKFNDVEKNADVWVQKINAVASATRTSSR